MAFVFRQTPTPECQPAFKLPRALPARIDSQFVHRYPRHSTVGKGAANQRHTPFSIESINASLAIVQDHFSLCPGFCGLQPSLSVSTFFLKTSGRPGSTHKSLSVNLSASGLTAANSLHSANDRPKEKHPSATVSLKQPFAGAQATNSRSAANNINNHSLVSFCLAPVAFL